MNEIIDVDFVDITEPKGIVNSVAGGGAETVAITAAVEVIKAISNDVKEYQMTKEHEKTQRAAIKANLQRDLAEIKAKQEVMFKYLDQNHEKNMMYLSAKLTEERVALDHYIEWLNGAMETATKDKDYEAMSLFMKAFNEFYLLHSKTSIELLNATNKADHSMLPGKNTMMYLE